MEKKLNPWLDLCRSLAIIMVILSHGRVFLMPAFPSAQHLKFGGFLGVELFFVLSGFLIGRIIFDKIEKSDTAFGWIPSFWFRRWMRTYPSYILFLILNLLLIDNIRPDAQPNLLAFSTFTQSLTIPHPSFFGEAWSLAVEEVFYFSFPIVISIFLFAKANKRNSIILSISTIIAISLAFRINAAINTPMTFNEIRSTSFYRLDSLMIGVIFSWLFLSKKINIFSKLGISLVPVAIYIAAKPDAFMDNSVLLKIFLFDVANIGFACLITVFYHIEVNPMVRFVTSRMARWSYAAYLTNLPVLYFINHYISKPTSLIGCISIWLFFIVMTIFISKLVYDLFEVKVLQLRDRMKSA
ncbi:O-acetyltransferase OatA [Serratia quinivorans]|uniref:acyltransferase family protein n=1 Tax=Serratia quinivorans TaxID=137545 RepID=UPI002177F5EE|nr:acyltransferase [Serratia quinivorans]CAI1557617.1 O-acetyltransferase OatA [Serratia quinivorans]